MSAESTAVLLRLPPDLRLTDDQLYAFCRLNRELRIERTAQGGLVIMAPAGGDSSDKNAEITMQLRLWAKRDGTGRTFDSSGGSLLANGAARSPDASWFEDRVRSEEPARGAGSGTQDVHEGSMTRGTREGHNTRDAGSAVRIGTRT